MTAMLPRIAVLGTGGTISSLGASSLDLLDYIDTGQRLAAEALIDRYPETRLVADPRPVTLRQVASTEIGPADWLALRAAIHRIADAEPATAGFVITHGTATLEETAFFLNLTLRTAQPVVLVGAQRPASAIGSDAGMNLVAALRVAGAAEARGKGVLVVLNDEIHAARDVVKTPPPTGCRPSARPISARSGMSTATASISTGRRSAPICRRRRLRLWIWLRRCRASTSSIPTPARTATWSTPRSPAGRRASSRPGSRRAARPRRSAPPSSVRRRPGSSSSSAAAPFPAGWRRAAGCARPASSPGSISARKRPASSCCWR